MVSYRKIDKLNIAKVKCFSFPKDITTNKDKPQIESILKHIFISNLYPKHIKNFTIQFRKQVRLNMREKIYMGYSIKMIGK